MSLTLGEMDNFNLQEIDGFALNDIDRLSYDELIEFVRKLNEIVEETCNQNTLLSEHQAHIFININHIYMNEKKGKRSDSAFRQITVNVAIHFIKEFISWCIEYSRAHMPEIITALKQLAQLLYELAKSGID